MAWDTSTRKATLPPNWEALRTQARQRANGICEHKTNGQRCTNPGSELHHTGHREDHRLEVLEWICRQCHRKETQRQSRQAWNNKYIHARKREPEQHPGTL